MIASWERAKLTDDPLTQLNFDSVKIPPERLILNIGIYVGEMFIFVSFVFVVNEEAIMQTEKTFKLGLSRPCQMCFLSFDPGRGTSVVSARKWILGQIWTHHPVDPQMLGWSREGIPTRLYFSSETSRVFWEHVTYPR